MWLVFLVTAALAGAEATPAAASDSLVGKVRVAGSSIKRVISIVVDDQAVRLDGELVSEIKKLASFTVEVLGKRDGDRFSVTDYRIIDIGGGAKPLVGQLVTTAAGLAIRDGGGTPIPLSVPARSRARLEQQVGAKIWVHGKKLVSGEYKVLRYGVLRAHRSEEKSDPAEPTNDDEQRATP